MFRSCDDWGLWIFYGIRQLNSFPIVDLFIGNSRLLVCLRMIVVCGIGNVMNERQLLVEYKLNCDALV